MKCPNDGAEMDHVSRHGVEIDHCSACGGVWLDGGELDHLMAAVRPAIELGNPDPSSPPRPSQTRGVRHKSPVHSDDRPREALRPSKASRFAGRYSGKARLKNILEEIFDFD